MGALSDASDEGTSLLTSSELSSTVVDGELFVGEDLGLPLLGLWASGVSDLICAILRSRQCLHSRRSSPDLVSPTFITTVVLEGREVILNGPCYGESNPVVLCCRV